MIKPLKIKVRRADNPGVLHNSREDVRRLGEALNKAIDKINEIVRVVNRLEIPDISADNEGEFWSPRGIVYDLSGFVESRQAGERIVQMFRDVLRKEPKTWLDYRERKPDWIQVRVQADDVDLNTLYQLTVETGIITRRKIRIALEAKEGKKLT